VVSSFADHEVICSIVFSCWKKTLDILGKLLRARDIQPIRVDGDVSYPERLERLAKFQQCPEASVLLMTYGTGAVGLNLTAANRIHIVEPQWNPCVEEQAIGRALRLGQSREVTVVRYVMKNTVEQNIIVFQKRKEKLAKFTFDGGLEDSLPQKLEEMKFILYTSQ
jgi:SNF2 family DNA or RNA helicase